MPLTVCPNCAAAMSEVSRRGVFVDICPSCRGVWLDGGELEKLLATADAGAPEAPAEPRYTSRDDYRRAHRDDDRRRRYDDDDDDDRRRKGRREGGIFEMFGDLFD
ncbi:MAG: zf-TFIIB domain-containing protein [Neomegalonema sp.]|nr:zf-TFIIB domain-containing protein [Neomegalonema sp.]